MKEDLWARFGARFIDTARTRLSRVSPVVDAGSREGLANVVHEMHSLAGEASMLGVAPIAELARRVEVAAKKWGGATDEDAAVRAACATALGRLGEALEKLAASEGHP
jgi:HPt (histidine-containing phosphotransfer) domain-containing protein